MITTVAFLFSVILIGLWTSPQAINALYFGKNLSVTKSDKLYPYFLPKQIAATENGSVYVVWVDNNSVHLGASKENGTEFAPITYLSDNFSIAAYPQIAATEIGSVYVVWVDKNSTSGDSDTVFRASTDGGKNFGRTKTLSRDIESVSSLQLSSSPQLAVTESGNVHIVWVDTNSTSGDSDIVFRGSATSGEKFRFSKGLSRDIQGSPPLLSSSPHIAATESGSVYVVWVDTNSTSEDSDIMFRASTDGGNNFGRTKTLSTDIEGSTSSLQLSSSPQIAVTESGNVHVVWVDKNSTSGDSDVISRHTSISHGGMNFSETLPQNRGWYRTDRISTTSSPQIAATENGSVYLVWIERRLQFKENFNNGEIFGDIVSIGRGTTTSPSPQIAATESGNVYVAWIATGRPDADKILFLKRMSQFNFERNR
jgi:hypothetical protein